MSWKHTKYIQYNILWEYYTHNINQKCGRSQNMFRKVPWIFQIISCNKIFRKTNSLGGLRTKTNSGETHNKSLQGVDLCCIIEFSLIDSNPMVIVILSQVKYMINKTPIYYVEQNIGYNTYFSTIYWLQKCWTESW